MKLRSFELTDHRQIVEVPLEAGSPAWFEDPVHRWLDLEAPEEEELNAFLEPLEIDPEMLRARMEPGSNMLLENLENLLLIRIPTQATSTTLDFTNILLLCLPTTLVTIHRDPLPAISDMASRLTGRTRLKSATTSALVFQVIGRLVAENFFAFGACRQKQEALAKRMIENSDSIEPEDVFTLRLQITNIGDANEDHAFCVDVLQRLETTSFSVADQREHFKELDRTLERHQRSMDRLEENVKDLHQQFLLAGPRPDGQPPEGSDDSVSCFPAVDSHRGHLRDELREHAGTGRAIRVLHDFGIHGPCRDRHACVLLQEGLVRLTV